MSNLTRREFLSRSAKTAVAVAAANAALASSWAQTSNAVTRVAIDSTRQVAPIERRIFGSFLEHLGRSIYTGIYDPGNKLSDANGYRTDVMKTIHDLGVPIIRYPGGNFVSGYHWLDGVGPKKDRPHVLDRAWNTMESNQFGINDFITWARQTGVEPLFGLNFGTGSVEDAVAEVEYCNVDKGTKWSDLRRSHGFEQPHNVKVWCLGNEMDGPWQIGHMTARAYGAKALDAAKQMRVIDPDPNLKLIACGSSGPFMPTYLEWDREVLEECYDQADGISLHRYWGNDEETGHDSQKYVAMNLAMDRQIEEIIAVCDIVRGEKRSPKTLHLSFDEWNVWYRARSGDAVNGHRQYAPHLLEEIYNLEDALLVGGLVNSLLRHCDRVKVACLAQLVNVIAPIMTNENGLYRQTIFYPYQWALQYARGTTLSVVPQGPMYDVRELGHPTEAIGITGPGFGAVPYLDVVATIDGKSAALFVLNRDLEHPRQLELNWHDLTPTQVTGFQTITGNDLKAVNSFDQPNHVAPQKLDAPKAGQRMTMEFPARSYSVITLSL
jgi:alpha-N-arabinofuranosidase